MKKIPEWLLNNFPILRELKTIDDYNRFFLCGMTKIDGYWTFSQHDVITTDTLYNTYKTLGDKVLVPRINKEIEDFIERWSTSVVFQISYEAEKDPAVRVGYTINDESGVIVNKNVMLHVSDLLWRARSIFANNFVEKEKCDK